MYCCTPPKACNPKVTNGSTSTRLVIEWADSIANGTSLAGLLSSWITATISMQRKRYWPPMVGDFYGRGSTCGKARCRARPITGAACSVYRANLNCAQIAFACIRHGAHRSTQGAIAGHALVG